VKTFASLEPRINRLQGIFAPVVKVGLVESGAVIGVVEGYTHDPRLAVLVPARYVIELLKNNNVGYEEFPALNSQ